MAIARKLLRIVSLAPSSTSILCSIGAAKSLVGVSKWCGDVANVSHLRKFGDCWHLDNVAAIQALKPDLVIGSVPFRAEALTKLLTVPLNFLALNPQSLADIDRDILQLGGITGQLLRSRRLIQKMHQAFARIAKQARMSRRPRLRVYSEAWSNPRIASPPWVAELIDIAGGTMITASGSRVSDEDVARGNPDVILLAWAATGSRAKTSTAYSVKLWQNVPALLLRHVFVIQDELLNTPGPPLVQGVKEIARIFARCRKEAVSK